MIEKIDQGLSSFLLVKFLLYRVVLGCFRVGDWFIEVVMMFLKVFLSQNKLKIKFLKKKKHEPQFLVKKR
jgi:hypothetical protein